MKLIVGLGNPGERYQHSRHNMGFWVVDALAEKDNLHFRRQSECESLIAQSSLSGESFLLAKPLTYMNQSGRAFSKLLKTFEISTDNVLVILDDIFLRTGLLRFRPKGSAGGHHGLESILEACPNIPIARLRLGVGFPQNQSQGWVEHVLGPFERDELERVPGMIQRAIGVVESFVIEGAESAQKWLSDFQPKEK